MHATVRPGVRAFFERYERAARERDTEALTSSFAEPFLSLDPSTVYALTPQALIAALPRRQALFESIGSDGLDLERLEETPLDDDHTLVRTSWSPRLRSDSSRAPMSLKSTVLLRRDGETWRIVVYLNHQDLARLFSSLGTP